MKNKEVQRALFENDLKPYHLAEILGIRKESAWRKLRAEMSADEQKRICILIDAYAKEKKRGNADGAKDDGRE